MASVVLVVLAGVVLAVTGKRATRPAPNPGASRRGIALAAVTVVMPLALAACGSSPGKPTTSTGASVVLAPVQVAHTQLGPVGYRVVGSGPPLVLIMGYTGTMEDWDPRFVDALARHYQPGGTRAVAVSAACGGARSDHRSQDTLARHEITRP